MLAGQELVQVDQGEPRRQPLGEHLPDGHRVVRLEVVAGAVLDAVLQQGHAAAGGEGRPHVREHRLRVGHLVVDVGQHDPVDRAGRQLQVVGRAQHGDDARHPVAVSELAHDVEHLGLDVDAVDAAPRRHPRGDAAGVVPRPAPHVGHHVARFERHGVEHQVGPLFVRALRPFEPPRAAEAHEVGRHPVPRRPVRRRRLRRHAAGRQDEAERDDARPRRPRPPDTLVGLHVVPPFPGSISSPLSPPAACERPRRRSAAPRCRGRSARRGRRA